MISGPVLKYPGAKWTIGEWILSFVPKHRIYLEPFFGSGALFFTKHPSEIETINDINGDVVNLFCVIRNNPEKLAELVEMTPWARDEYYKSYEKSEEPIEAARRFLVRCWMAFGTKTSDRTGWRNDIQGRKYISCPNRWKVVPNRIIETALRLKDAQIENQPAVQLIKRYNFKDVFVYADPPYPLSTRSGRMYANEMLDEDHLELLETLKEHKGPVIIFGYACKLYDEILKGWRRETRKTLAELAREREEVLWMNDKVFSEGTLF
jgi:DNA adenine methylase